MTARTTQIDPEAIKPFGWDWTGVIPTGDTITACTATATNVTAATPVIDGATTYAVLSAAVKPSCTVTFHITTDSGFEDDRTISLNVVDL